LNIGPFAGEKKTTDAEKPKSRKKNVSRIILLEKGEGPARNREKPIRGRRQVRQRVPGRNQGQGQQKGGV